MFFTLSDAVSCNVSYKFTTDGDHAIKLFVTTAGNEKAGPCTAAETFVVTAKLIPPATFDVSNDAKWSHWSFSDGGIAEGQRVDHSFSNLDDDSVYVTLQSCNRLNCCADTTIGLPVEVTTVWFANMFTPDREDNNRFGMVTTLTLLEYELYIYNRNGQLVWHTTDQNELWDGKTSDGGVAPQGTYAYFCRYSYVKDSYHTTNGNITLVR